jgi:FkbM family methyltransferase
MAKFKLNIILILIIIIVLLLLWVYSKRTAKMENTGEYYDLNNFDKDFDNLKNVLIDVKNPYLTDNSTIKWAPPDKTNILFNLNFPSVFNFDFDIKEDIINHALKLPLNYGIIDCGAHIGDGAIPIAHTLIKKGRPDLIVYAIDPSTYKCKIIEYFASINNLTNIKVICCGLSNENTEYTYVESVSENTGGTNWKSLEKNEGIVNTESQKFYTLDYLVQQGRIKNNIGVIHLDVEGMEDKALEGGKNTIDKFKPYLSLENHNPDTNIFLKYLPTGYKYMYNKAGNNILMFNN